MAGSKRIIGKGTLTALAGIVAVLVLSLAGKQLFVRADAAPVLPAGTYCQGPQSYQPTTGPTHVMHIVLENEFADNITNSPDAPFQNNTLSTQCGNFTNDNMKGITHGSESNYIGLTSGLNPALNSGNDAQARWALSDCPPDSTSSVCTYGGGHIASTTPSLFSEIEQQYGTSGWKSYSDSELSNCENHDDNIYATDSNGKNYYSYAVRHNPAPYYAGIACSSQSVPSGNWQQGQGTLYNDLMSGNLPAYSFVQPNDIENGHDPVSVTGSNGVTTQIAGGSSQIGNIDTYLASFMSLVQQSPQYQNGSLVVMITYDEGTGSGISGDDQVGQNCADPAISASYTSCDLRTWIVGRYVPATSYGSYMNLFGLLQATQRILGLSPLLGHAADSTTPDIVTGTASNPNPFNLLPSGAATAPSAPVMNGATAGVNAATVAFTQPTNSGGSPVINYTVTASPGGATANGTASPITVGGLTAGTNYSFTVTATNVVGTSLPSSASNVVTPVTAGVPSAPTNLSATIGNGQISLAWTAPSSNGGAPISDYTVQYRVTGTSTWNTFPDGVSTATNAVVSGLTNGTSYDFQVGAVNSTGQGAMSSPLSATPVAPATELLPDPGFESGNGGWAAFNVGTLTRVTSPVHGGNYAMQVAATGTNVALVGLTQNSVITNSVAGQTYNFQCYVQATGPNLNLFTRFLEYTQNWSNNTNLGTTTTTSVPVGVWTLVQVKGVAAQSGDRIIPQIYSSSETTQTGNLLYDDCSVTAPSASSTPPSAPLNPSATAGNGNAVVSFSAPSSNGGSPVTGYTVTSSPGNVVASGSSSPITVSGLSNGSSYSFTVTASNSAGTGSASGATTAVTPAGVPAAPTALTTSPAAGQVGLAWTAPASNGAAITDYVVQYRQSGTSSWTVFADGVSAATSATVTGLSNGTSYDFIVSAVNSAGQGPASSVASAMPVSVPGAPTNVTATAGDGYASVSFTPPASNGGSPITSYTVTANPGGATTSGSSSPLTVSGLADGTSYSFTVTATNALGTSAPSTASNSVTPTASVSAPSAPSNVSAVAGNASAVVSFSLPASNGGDPNLSYSVTSSPGNVLAVGSSSPITITGLTNGTSYTFTVTASNSAGMGPSSSASNSVTPITVPGAPTNVTAIAGNGSAVVSFSAPSSNGGSAITSYSVTSNPGNIVTNGTSSPITVSGLTNGTSYSFTVTAGNNAGTSSASSASSSVTPTASAPNLLTNGGFESGISSIHTYSSSSALSSVTSPVHSGTYALKVTGSTATAGFNGVTIPGTSITGGKTLTAQCWVLATGSNYKAHVKLSEGSNYTSIVDTTSNTLTLNTWTLVSTTAVVQKSGDQIVLSGYTNNQVSGSGLVWDDCSVTSN